MNFTADTFDFYVNGSLIRTATNFRYAAASLRRIDLYNFNSATAFWDEILVN
jgi:hypothetical protein